MESSDVKAPSGLSPHIVDVLEVLVLTKRLLRTVSRFRALFLSLPFSKPFKLILSRIKILLFCPISTYISKQIWTGCERHLWWQLGLH